MNVKRYIASDTATAMNQIREELGLDAFILNQRTFRKKGIKGLFSKPLVEVVAAYETPEQKRRSVTVPTPQAAPPVQPSPAKRRPMYTTPDNPALKTAEKDIHETAALSILEKLAQSAPAVHDTPPAPASISAYSPRGTSRKEPVSAPAENEFRPLFQKKEEPFSGINNEKNIETEKMASIESKIDALSTTLSGLVNKMALSKEMRGSFPPEVEKILLSFSENDVEPEFAQKLAREVTDIIHKQGADASEVMEQILRQTLGEASPLKLKRFKRSVVLLVGPTGVGKTTTLAKLAAIYRLNHHAKVAIITTDTYRIAAVDQLKTYAEILEVPITVCYSPDDIGDALSEHEDKDVVFIDTAGRSPNSKDLEDEVTSLVKKSDCDEVHLVISATTSFTGLLNIINSYGFLRDYKVIITKLDETPSWGVLLNAKFLTDKPISYVAAGQNVPDDIEVMNARKIIDRLMGK